MILSMKQKINYFYLTGSLVLFLAGSAKLLSGNHLQIFGTIIVVFSIVYILLAFNFLKENNFTKTSLVMLLLAIVSTAILDGGTAILDFGAGIGLWQPPSMFHSSSAILPYFLLVIIQYPLGVAFLIVGLIVGFFKKSENVTS
jgi:hypothetical protein